MSSLISLYFILLPSNIIKSPNDEKYRRVKKQNKSFSSKVWSLMEAQQFLLHWGWIEVMLYFITSFYSGLSWVKEGCSQDFLKGGSHVQCVTPSVRVQHIIMSRILWYKTNFNRVSFPTMVFWVKIYIEEKITVCWFFRFVYFHHLNIVCCLFRK